MVKVTVRDVPEKIYLALKLRAMDSGHGIETEILLILEQATAPQINLKQCCVGGGDLEVSREQRIRKIRSLVKQSI